MSPRHHNRAAAPQAPPDWATVPVPGAQGWPATLAAWRLSQGVQQAELARALGVARNTVARWEKCGLVAGPATRERFEALAKGGPEAVRKLARRQAEKMFA